MIDLQRAPNLLLSLIIPVYNEEAVLPLLISELRERLKDIPAQYEVLFINDGSRDRTAEVLQAAAQEDPRVKVLSFSRNFGHQTAVTAGLDFAQGDAVVVMDADLQDPPELLPRMLELYLEGYDVVSPQRIEREGETGFKRWTARGFYWLMRKGVDARLPAEVGDFRLFSREAVDALRVFREQHRFLRGLVAWLGLKEAFIPFRRQPRAAGVTKYPLHKMLRFAWTAICSFSAMPLRATLLAGITLTGVGCLYLAYVIYATLILRVTVPGWSSIVSLQILFSGAILASIGLVGDYVARLFDEAKRRPLYVVNQTYNFEPTQWRHIERAIVFPSDRPTRDGAARETPLTAIGGHESPLVEWYETRQRAAANLPSQPR